MAGIDAVQIDQVIHGLHGAPERVRIRREGECLNALLVLDGTGAIQADSPVDGSDG